MGQLQSEFFNLYNKMKFETYSALITFFVCLNDVCNADPLIWFSTKDTIKTTHVGTYKSQLIVSNIYGVSSISPFADYIYWTQPDKIMRAKKDGSNVEELVSFGSHSLTGIAVDFVTGDIYYACVESVGVCSNIGSNCRTFYTDYVNDPRGLVLHPQRGLMYWGNQDGVNMIVVATTNGTDVRPLFAKNVIDPRNLAIDYETDRLYWADFTSYKSVDLDGKNYRQIYSLMFANAHGVAVYQDRMFMTYRNTVEAVDKFSGRDSETFVYDKQYIDDIQIEQHI